MATTLSGHTALVPTSLLLSTRAVPGRPEKLRTHRAYLPLFLRLAVLLDNRVQQLSTADTWSYNYRQARMASGLSDHAGYACDFWSAGIGAHIWPTHMPADKATAMGHVLEGFRTVDGRHIFGWGAVKGAPGVDYTGPLYTQHASSDPMHVYVAPGVSPLDAWKARKAMGIRADGTIG